MINGTVKWFDPAKGYGFIAPADGDKDVFVHINTLQQAGLSTLAEGQKVSFEKGVNSRGKIAVTQIELAAEA